MALMRKTNKPTKASVTDAEAEYTPPAPETPIHTPTQETPMADEQIRIVTLKSWGTGVFNENQMPILTIETFDDQKLSLFLTPEAAIELGKSLQQTGEQTMRSPRTTN
jgi:hypothetical protein